MFLGYWLYSQAPREFETWVRSHCGDLARRDHSTCLEAEGHLLKDDACLTSATASRDTLDAKPYPDIDDFQQLLVQDFVEMPTVFG